VNTHGRTSLESDSAVSVAVFFAGGDGCLT